MREARLSSSSALTASRAPRARASGEVRAFARGESFAMSEHPLRERAASKEKNVGIGDRNGSFTIVVTEFLFDLEMGCG
jgi:hypothetical protein